MSIKSRKISVSTDKRQWRPSFLPGQIVLVSTADSLGQFNVAPKSWVTMVAFGGPMVAFGCNVGHTTYQNIISSSSFVINVPHASMASKIWELPYYQGQERLERSRFGLLPSSKVEAPLIEECHAHLECELDHVKRYGDEVLIIGKILRASIDEDCLTGHFEDSYFRLRPLFFLEDGIYGTLDTAHRVNTLPPVNQLFFLIEVRTSAERPAQADLLKASNAFLADLHRGGCLLLAGSYQLPARSVPGGTLARMYIVSSGGENEARKLAEQDPFVTAGGALRVRPWSRMF